MTKKHRNSKKEISSSSQDRSVIRPKRPAQTGWRRNSIPGLTGLVIRYPLESWFHPQSGLSVLTSVEVADKAGQPQIGPQYHLSISKSGPLGPQRCTSSEALWVLAQFEIDGTEEDTHVPRDVVRNFWRPVAENLVGLECASKASEPAMVEDRGDFVWRG